jgi:hypothetical protein
MAEEKEAFLERWSRLKREQPEEKPAVQEAKKETAAPLKPVEDLKPDSDFTPFMDPGVDPGTRRLALKKLFGDPHFNEPDLFEPYSLDLTVGETIPEEMLKTLNQAKRLLFDEKEQVAQAPTETQAPPQPQASEANPKDVAGKQDA